MHLRGRDLTWSPETVSQAATVLPKNERPSWATEDVKPERRHDETPWYQCICRLTLGTTSKTPNGKIPHLSDRTPVARGRSALDASTENARRVGVPYCHEIPENRH